MAKFELKLPKMGESVAEATINSWLKDIGDRVKMDESVVEISTDKVDSDVPSEVSGILVEKNDFLALSDAFITLSKSDLNILGKNSRKLYLSKFSEEIVYNAIFCYHTILQVK